MKRDFEPATSKRNVTCGYRLLILDGHNSHTTYKFCAFAEKHKIIIICLPSHTTHRLQPCDVGIFGPLAASWKKEVIGCSSEYIQIRKHNLVKYYSRARSTAFVGDTIRSAFRKTGIWPYNPEVIEEAAFAPSLNTTTQAAQLVAAVLPDILIPVIPLQVEDPIPLDKTLTVHGGEVIPGTMFAVAEIDMSQFTLAGLPAKLPMSASRDALFAHVNVLRDLLDKAQYQMEVDYASRRLGDRENGRLRARLFDKSNKHKKKETTSHARHMTSEEVLDALAKDDWRLKMKDVWNDPAFKAQKKACDAYARELVTTEKADEREIERSQKDAEREAEKARKDAEKEKDRARKAEERQAKAAEKLRLSNENKLEKARAKGLKDAAAALAKAQKATDAATTKAAKAAAHALKMQEVAAAKARRAVGLGTIEVVAPADSDELLVVVERPRPRPRRHIRTRVGDTDEVDGEQ